MPPLWPTPLRLNLGCGKHKIDGWLNVDAFEQVRPDYVLDVVAEPWPWSNVEEIAAYHLIEHLSRVDGETMIRKCFDALRPGGKLTLECPDVDTSLARAVSSPSALKYVFGNQTTPFQHHRWGYTASSLSGLLQRIGFDPVESGPGTDYHTKSEKCIRVEGVKP